MRADIPEGNPHSDPVVEGKPSRSTEQGLLLVKVFRELSQQDQDKLLSYAINLANSKP